METEISRLNLVSPLFFEPIEESQPFGNGGEAGTGGEKLFCFELDESSYRSFEPDRALILKELVFSGKAVKGSAKGAWHHLPQGNYLFAQKREILSKEEIIGLAVEIQQEGLWQRLRPGKMLYLRYLFEDGRPVTQLFRPYEDGGS